MGGLSGADADCLSDLQANNWLNKTDASSRGLLNSSHVQAFLCTGSTCQTPLASTTYTFAVSGTPATGGATFTTDSSSQGPNNSQNWSGTNYFGTNASYWTGQRWGGTDLYWPSTSDGNQAYCGSWSDSSTAYAGVVGNSNWGTSERWELGGVLCNNTERLLCMVHPGNETAAGNPGYLVMSSSTYNGNLGDLSGANSKCLTELTTYTNWMGYSSANANGQLISGKVFALLCRSDVCNDMNANTTYNFAIVGSAATGGASFTTNASGEGPNDNNNWSGASYFGGNYQWWSNRISQAADNRWDAGVAADYNNGACSYNWGDSTSANSGFVGVTTSTVDTRWKQILLGCDQLEHLLCFVNP